jgi:hypothetical protein
MSAIVSANASLCMCKGDTPERTQHHEKCNFFNHIFFFLFINEHRIFFVAHFVSGNDYVCCAVCNERHDVCYSGNVFHFDRNEDDSLVVQQQLLIQRVCQQAASYDNLVALRLLILVAQQRQFLLLPLLR